MKAKLVAGIVVLTAACGGTTGPTRSDGGTGASGSEAGGSSGASGSGARGGAAAGGGGNACNPACGMERDCCAGRCANLQNDPLNCGRCGKSCDQGTYCTGGECVTPPCETTCSGSAQCCGPTCCGAGQLCCDSQGPISTGPACIAPVDGTCPLGCAPLCKCASPDTPIATPDGSRPIASLQVGDLVYSVDRGEITVVPIVRTNRTPVSGHSVMRIMLESGAVLEISALHPTADSRTFGMLERGDELDGVAITSAALVPYRHDATYDVLPESDTGAYFAGGVLIGSTLATRPVPVMQPTTPLDSSEIGVR